MRSIRKTGVTALTAAIALSLGAVPVALTVPAIVASGEGTTTVTPATLPAGWASAGSLELSTTPSTTASAKFVPASGSPSTQNFSASNCTPLTEGAGDLLRLVGNAKDNKGATVTKPVGLLKGGFGVQDKGTGTSCGRVDSGASESLTLTLGDKVLGVLGSKALASSARLDLDLKGGARVTATATGPTGSFTKFLQSGTPLPGDSGNLDVTSCSPKSDSGPDSGANDNCDWTITAPDPAKYFTSLTLVANTGSFALSGGSDYVTDPGTHRSRFELAEKVDGELCVGDDYPLSGTADGTTPPVVVTRLGNADNSTGVCVPYLFKNGLQNAELLKPLTQEGSAQFVFDFVWTLPADTTPGDAVDAGLVRRTTVDFDGESGLLDAPDVISLCPDLEYKWFDFNKNEIQDEGETFPVVSTILDNSTNTKSPDLAKNYPVGADTKQFACIVSQDLVPIPGTAKVKVNERIYAYGDIRLSKP